MNKGIVKLFKYVEKLFYGLMMFDEHAHFAKHQQWLPNSFGVSLQSQHKLFLHNTVVVCDKFTNSQYLNQQN